MSNKTRVALIELHTHTHTHTHTVTFYERGAGIL